MLDWSDYHLLLAIARSGSLRAAADDLHINHATVSRRLAALTEAQGYPLFDREAGQYVPTEAGKILLNAARAIERHTLEAERQIASHDMNRGTARLTISLPNILATDLLLDDLLDLRRAMPDVTLSLHSGYHFVDMDRRDADVVIRITNTPPDHLVGRRLFPYARCEYARAGYLNDTPPEQRSWLGWPGDARHPEWVRDTTQPDAPVDLRVLDFKARNLAARAGAGMILDACFVADRCPELARLPGAIPKPDRMIWMLTHPDLRAARPVRLAMGFLSDRILAHRDLIEGRLTT